MNSVAQLFGVEGRAHCLASSAKDVLRTPDNADQTIKSLLHVLRADSDAPKLQDRITWLGSDADSATIDLN